MKLTIKCPATSANVGVGFDSLALAFNRYNIFEFESTNRSKLSGFSHPYHNLKTNLLYQTYVKFASEHEKEIVPVHIHMKQQNIPASRGLGSSASVILAAVMASNTMHQLNLSFEDVVNIAARYEGHGDNIYACAFGHLTTIFKDQKRFYHQTIKVHPSLHFYSLIPSEEGSTKKLRSVLPHKVLREDAVFHLSRMPFVMNAFHHGDFDMLKKILKDTLHESYRFQVLNNTHYVEMLRSLDVIVTLSGSGPSLLVISKQPNFQFPEAILAYYQIQDVKISEGIEMR
jgi:homoserine kinase